MNAAHQLDLVGDPNRAAALLHPLRLRILQALAEPDSAAGVARKLRMPRQQVNYHVRELARARFLKRAGQRRKRNMIERRFVASARGYLLSPELLGRVGLDARRVEDTFSAAYLLALTSQMQSELGRAWRAASAQGKRLATLSISTEVRFESAGQRAEFTHALQRAVVDAVGRHATPARSADGAAAPGRLYRLILGCYPVPSEKDPQQSQKEGAHGQ